MKRMFEPAIRCLFSISKRKKILICPDKFKFSMTASQIANTIKNFLPQYCSSSIVELADGGQGSLEAISKKIKGGWVKCKVNDPLFRTITSEYFVGDDNQSYIEMAKASGLQLLPKDQRNPLLTSTYGTGQLILDSLMKGHSAVNLLIGGSATNDGGIGAACALGFKFLDENKHQLSPIGQNLRKIKTILRQSQMLKQMVDSSKINVFTDVKNVFTGENGASKVYAPQKGASGKDVEQLQVGMINLKQLFKNQFQVDVDSIAGSGAAGGLGGGCKVFLNSQLYRGIDLIFTLNNFEASVRQCDVIVTGQGKVDGQTLEGKVVKGVIDRATKYGKKVIVLCAFCTNKQHFHSNGSVELVQLLKSQQQIKIIDPKLTKNRLQEFAKSYNW